MLDKKILGLNYWVDLFSWEANMTMIIKSKNGNRVSTVSRFVLAFSAPDNLFIFSEIFFNY